MPVPTICGFCKKSASVTHNLVKFPTGLMADCFTCQQCGSILAMGRAGNVEQPKVVKPSAGEIHKLGLN